MAAYTGLPVKAAPIQDYGRFYTSAELLVLSARFSSNPAYATFTVGPPIVRESVNFSHDFTAAPAVTLGWTPGNGLGWRGRAFYFESGANEFVAPGVGQLASAACPLSLCAGFAGAPGSTLNIHSKLRMAVADLEGTWRNDSGHYSTMLSFGVRYAHLQQDFDVDFATAVTAQTLRSGHRTHAVGPTLAAEVEAPVKQLPGFYIFGNARGAVLFGNRRHTASLTTNAVPGEQASETGQTLLPVVEGEIGAGYRHPVARGEIYLRASMVGQAWFSAGNASNTETLSTPLATDELTNPNATLGLWGARFTAGVKF